MKKLFLMLTMLVMSITGAFAYNTYREMVYGTDIYEGKLIHINSYCSSVQLDVYWTGFSEGTSGSIQCAEYPTGVTIGHHSWMYDGTSEMERFHANLFGQYLGTVILYLEAFMCYGQAEFTWTI